jgi:chromosome segregation ATPase
VALETSLAETSNRFETTDSKIRELQVRIVEQAQQLEASLSSTTVQLEATNNQVKALERKLKVEQLLQKNMLQDTQAQLRKHDERLNWAMVTAVFTLILVAVAGAILF